MSSYSTGLANAAHTSSLLVASLFVVEGVDQLTMLHLDHLGIVPRTLIGLRGIVFSPLLHANFAHLVANAIPLWILLSLLFADRHYEPGGTLAMIWLVSGVGTWLIGRGQSVHVGASSLIYGLVTYLIVAGFLMRSWRAALIAMGVLLFYGGLFYGALPQAGPISWEGHLCGALTGFWAARRIH